MVLSVLDRDGGAGHDAFSVLDHGQQQLDASANGLRRREWSVRADGLGEDRLQSGIVGALPTHAACILYHRRVCVAATGAWYLLRQKYPAESYVMLRMGLFLAAILVPVQIFFGHLNGDYVHDYQPAKFAAIEARWHDEQPAGEVLIAIPDEQNQTNYFEIKVPVLGSLIGSMSFNSKEVGLTDFPRNDWPPVFIPFWSFRIMVGCGLIMLLFAWVGSYLSVKERLGSSRLMLWLIFLSFPLPFIAILTGWFTAEVGRQPWTVYGVLRTADALTPFLTARAALVSLIVFCLVYTLIFAFGALYIHHLLRIGPIGRLAEPPANAVPNRPLSVVDEPVTTNVEHGTPGE